MQFLIDVGLSIVYFSLFLLVCAWSWRFWMMYVNQKFLNGMDWIMLEIKLPREINKSPLATEMAIATLLQTGGISNKHARLFKGGLPAYSSLEIASIEGTIHFYVRIQKKYRALVESNFYAQYPGIEIVEADDYTNRIYYDHLSKDVSLFGAVYKPSEKWEPINPETGKPYEKERGKSYSMSADFFPIKTYVDYGLDKDQKEEYKIDPLAPILEMMGSIGKGEHFWYQILIQDESVYNDKKMPKFYVNAVTHKHLSLSDMVNDYKKKMRTAGYVIKGDKMLDEYGDQKEKRIGRDAEGKPIMGPAFHPETKSVPKKEMDLTSDEKDKLEAINRKLSKPLALAVVRAIYVAKKENSNGGQINNVLSLLKPFAGTNSMTLAGTTDPYDFPWQNFMGRRTPWRGEEMFEAYVEREGFFPHIKPRESLDRWEDSFFWASSMKNRKLFRMIYEAVFYPFEHPQASDVCTLNLEEIATLWHLPGATAGTPTLPRIDSTKGVAPTNLPI